MIAEAVKVGDGWKIGEPIDTPKKLREAMEQLTAHRESLDRADLSRRQIDHHFKRTKGEEHLALATVVAMTENKCHELTGTIETITRCIEERTIS